MKQNLIQQQLRLQDQQRSSLIQSSVSEYASSDLTSKAFFVMQEIFDSEYAFSKKSLVNFLLGKPILLQQNNNQQPPAVLKGYMSLYQPDWIEEMIEVMIWLNILKQDKYLLQKKSTLRLFVTKKYELTEFPKVIIKVKSKDFLEKPIIKTQNEGNSQLSKSRFTIFIKQKNVLQVNEEKRQEEMRLKAEKERQDQVERSQLEERQLKEKRQKQKEQRQKIEKQEIKKQKKQQEKKRIENKMNNFWMKEREKIEQVVNIEDQVDILLADSPKKSEQKSKDKAVTEIAGHTLQMQMKQLKENEEERKNPLKPIISWSFMKENIEEDKLETSQNSSITNSKLMLEKNQPESGRSKKFAIPKIPSSKKSYQTFLAISQTDNCPDSSSESTDVTQTNFSIKNRIKAPNFKHQKQSSPQPEQEVPVKILATKPEEEMFSSHYHYSRRSTESIPESRFRKQRQDKKYPEFDQLFSFKREKPLEENIEKETVSVVKKISRRVSSFEELENVLRKSKQANKLESISPQNDEDGQYLEFITSYSNTKTSTFQKTINQNGSSFHDKRDLSFRNECPAVQNIDLFSQTISLPEPTTRHQKTSTKDLKVHAQTQQPAGKRDSFAQELIDNYVRKR